MDGLNLTLIKSLKLAIPPIELQHLFVEIMNRILDLDEQIEEVEVMSFPVGESIVIDVRHPTERELSPLKLNSNAVLDIPFYELHGKYAELDQKQHYMLYCDKGTMSRLHASHLKYEGYHNVSVYRP